MIYADQFPSAVGIFPFDAKELLQRFLFAVGKTQERFIRSDPAVNIDTLKGIKAIGQIVLLAFLKQVRQIEIIAVKMYQMSIIPRKTEKGGQHFRFFLIIVCKPLLYIPFAVFLIGRADQVNGRTFGGKTGGFYIKKKNFI